MGAAAGTGAPAAPAGSPAAWDAPPTTPAPAALPAFAPPPEPEPEREPEAPVPVALPPELDVLPSWYTDPLPNGHRPAAAAEPPPPVTGADLTWPPLPVVEAPLSSSDRPLPGSGDELRSLFGQVVGDPAPPAPVSAPRCPRSRHPPPRRRRGIATPTRWGRRTRAAAARPQQARRLRAAAAGGRLRPGPGDRPGRSPGRGGAYRSAAPAAEPALRAAAEAPLRNPMAAGPAALPVIVLVVVVAILVLGIGWLVVAGDDAGPSASERQEASQADDGGAPSGVVAEASAGGVRVSWDGPADVSYVVTVLSATAPPQVLAPTVGTSAVVPAAPAGPGGDLRCFTVATVPGPGADRRGLGAGVPARRVRGDDATGARAGTRSGRGLTPARLSRPPRAPRRGAVRTGRSTAPPGAGRRRTR